MRDFLLKLVHAGAISGSKLVGSLVIAKLLALYAGPSGFAQFSQFQNLVQMGSGVAGGGIGQGLIRHLAESKDWEHRKRFFAIGLSLSMALTAIAVVIVLVVTYFAGTFIFSGEPLTWGVLASAALAINSMMNLAMSSLNGLGRSGWMAGGQAVGAVVTILFAWSAMEEIGVMGAAVGTILGGLSAGLWAITGLRAVGLSIFEADLTAWKRHEEGARSLMGYVVMSIGASISFPVALVLVRSGIGHYVSWGDAGQWSALWRLSDAYLMFVTMTISIYYLPRLAATKTSDGIVNEINSGLVKFLPLVASLAMLAWWGAPWIVLHLLSGDFSLVEKLIGIQIVGDVVKIAAWLHGNYLWARGETIIFVLIQFVFSFSFVVLCLAGLFFTNSVEGVVWGYVVNAFLHFSAVRKLVLIRVGKIEGAA